MFNELNTLRVFFESPSKEFSVREVARLINASPATASKRLKELSKKGFLKYRKGRLKDNYKADLDSDEYLDLKVYYTIRQLRETGLIKFINEQYLKPTIVLFGSASNGLDIENSDIDLVIISERISEFKLHQRFEKRLKRELQVFNVKDLSDLKNKHLINNVLNGIVIQGEIEWT